MNASFDNDLIFHNIFRHLSLVDLLLSQRVCQSWRQTIQHSQSLQEDLFLRPDYREARNGKVQINELLAKHFPGFFGVHEMEPSPIEWPDIVTQPFESSLWHQQTTLDGFDDDERGYVSWIRPSPMSKYSRPEASWRLMLPCRPAPLELYHVRMTTTGRTTIAGTISRAAVQKSNSPDDPDGAVPRPLHHSPSLEGDPPGSRQIGHLRFGVVYDLARGSEIWAAIGDSCITISSGALRVGKTPDEPDISPDEPDISPDEPDSSPDESDSSSDKPDMPPNLWGDRYTQSYYDRLMREEEHRQLQLLQTASGCEEHRCVIFRFISEGYGDMGGGEYDDYDDYDPSPKKVVRKKLFPQNYLRSDAEDVCDFGSIAWDDTVHFDTS